MLGEGSFYNRIKDTLLSEIDFGGTRHKNQSVGPLGETFYQAWHKFYPNHDFAVFPFSDPDYYSEVDNETFKTRFDSTFDNKINFFDSLSGNKFDVTNNTFVPFVYLNYVIEKIFESLGISISTNEIYNDEELRQLVLINNVSICNYNDNAGNINVVLNSTFNLQNHVPKIPVTEFFKFLEKQFKAFVIYNEFTNSVEIRFFKNIYNSAATNKFSEENISKIIISAADRSDGYTLKWENDSTDGIYDSPEVKDFSSNYFKGVVGTFVDLPTADETQINDFYYVQESGCFAMIVFSGSYVWVGVSNPFADINIGSKRIEINVPGAVADPDSAASTILQPGTFYYKEQFDTDFQFRLMFFKPNFNAATPYPRGTSLHYFTDDGKGLDWFGEYGLLENFYKEFIAMMQNKIQAECLVPFSPGELRQIKFSEKYRFLEANWLLSSIKFTVTNDKISPATIVGFKV
jgi:hypothetical protein